MSDYNNDDIKDTEDEQKYEDVCYMCRRPESKTGRMLHIPGMNNMCICIDCMERSFRVMDGSNYADLMQGMNIQDIFPGGLNMDDMMNMQNQIPKKQKLKKLRLKKLLNRNNGCIGNSACALRRLGISFF